MRRKDFIIEYNRIRDIALPMARLIATTGVDKGYPEQDMGMDIREDGVIFFDLFEDPYEDRQYVGESITVPWRDIDSPIAAAQEYEAQVETLKKQRAEQASQWKREQFARLKAELGE